MPTEQPQECFVLCVVRTGVVLRDKLFLGGVMEGSFDPPVIGFLEVFAKREDAEKARGDQVEAEIFHMQTRGEPT